MRMGEQGSLSEENGVRGIEDKVFLALVLVVSLAFGWIIAPFFGAILWGLVAAILFTPLNERLIALMPRRRAMASFVTLLIILAAVIMPAILIGAFMLQEAIAIYGKIQSGQINVERYFRELQNLLPDWAHSWLARSGLTDIDAVRQKLGAGVASSFQTVAGQAFNFGQSAFGFLVALGVMLYLTYFLLRDGPAIVELVDRSVPLNPARRRALFSQFVTVVRATIKGSIVVAIVQGAIGGTVFWMLGIQGAMLWGVCMGFFSLLPAIGTGLVWVPVAIYLLATGAIWQGLALVGCGLFVIGMVDNVLRPILVGRDTRMPDYVVLISTLGGLEVFGFNGFVIGPVIAALFMALWEIFRAAREEEARTDA